MDKNSLHQSLMKRKIPVPGFSLPGTPPDPADGPGNSTRQHSDSSIFKQAWTLLNSVREELVEPITLIRSPQFPQDKSTASVTPTSDSYASTLPYELYLSQEQKGAQKPIPEVFRPDGPLGHGSRPKSSEVDLFEDHPKQGRARSLPQKRSSITAAAEKKSSSGVNCLLDKNGKPAGTHRSNQAESTAQEYQQLLDGVQAFYPFISNNPKGKGTQCSKSFARLSEIYPTGASVRVSDGQLNSPEYLQKAQQGSDMYLQNVNDQLFRVNHERMRRQMAGAQPMNHNFLASKKTSSRNNCKREESEYGIKQNNNVNINLTLALSQIQHGGQIPVALSCDMEELKRPRSRGMHVDPRVRPVVAESAMQTELESTESLEETGTADSSALPSRIPSSQVNKGTTRYVPAEFEADSTSTFPSVTPSAQNWKRRQPQPVADCNGPQDSWMTNYIDIPAALSYTGESVRNFLETADVIINSFIIPPDDNPMSDADMNEGEDRVAISLMRLLGIPQQLRHNIYNEALHNIQAVQEVSSGTVDILSNLIDWLSNGDCGGREELLNKARLLASISTDFDPESEVWVQFEKEVVIFTDAVGEAMKGGYEVGKEAVTKCSQTLVQKLNSMSSTSTSISGPRNRSTVSFRDSTRPMAVIAEEAEESELSAQNQQIRPEPSNAESMNNNPSSSASSISRNVSRGRDQYRTDPLKALDREITKLSKLKEVLQSKTSIVTPSGPSIYLESTSSRTHGYYEESLDSIQEPEYPDVDLVDSNPQVYPGTQVRDGAYDSNFSITDAAEKRQLLRQCRDVARRMTEDINHGKNSTSSSSGLGRPRDRAPQYSEDVHSLTDYYPPYRTTDAFMEAPVGYDFGFTNALSSACQSIKSSILTQAQSAVSYFPLFQHQGTPILGESRCDSRDERMEMEPQERYDPELESRINSIGELGSELSFGASDYYQDDLSECGLPEPSSPVPPPIPKRQFSRQFVVVSDDSVTDTRLSRRDSIRRELNLPEPRQFPRLDISIKVNECKANEPISATTIVSDCSALTPKRPIIETGSDLVRKTSQMSSAASEAATELTELMEKLKPHWPDSSSGPHLSPEAQMKIAFSNFIEAKAQKVAEFIAADKLLGSPKKESRKETEGAEKVPVPEVIELYEPAVEQAAAPPELTVAEQPPVIQMLAAPEQAIAPELLVVPEPVSTLQILPVPEAEKMLEGVENPEADALCGEKEENKLQEELNQLEKIVHDLCTEVTGTNLPLKKADHCSGWSNDGRTTANGMKGSVSRIPTPTRVRTPFQIPPKNNKDSTIALYAPKPPMNAVSCVSIDSPMTRHGGNPAGSSPFGSSNRSVNRHSAFGRTLRPSTPQPPNNKFVPATVPVQSIRGRVNTGQRKAAGKPIPKTPLNKWTAAIPCTRPHQQQQQHKASQSARASSLPSRDTSKTNLVSRSNSYRHLFQMKQSFVSKSTGPIQLRKAGPGYQQTGGGRSGAGNSRSRAQAPMIPAERDRSARRSSPQAHGNNSGASSYLTAHGSRSRIFLPTNSVDGNANRAQSSASSNGQSGISSSALPPSNPEAQGPQAPETPAQSV